ncbi:other FunK1 protein kinase [Rhizoctonia solani]|uniref:Other FunK1 protein kinase n=1 Tax=Rhizoctonia solani TaxID=456999 RepID=A0A8H7LN66_9AGAM|nr:other FunK1 protein kinase [Rhizoctonia solani]
MEAQECGCTLDSNGKEIRASALESGPGGKPVVERYKMRVLTPDVGRPLGEVRSLDQFLRVMYDACVVQRNIYCESRILHRDISDNNVMIAPDDPEFYERCAEGYNRVKYINQVLSGNDKVPPRPACLVIDLGNGALVEPYCRDREVLAERIGTPKFMARSVSRGEPLAFRKHRGELSQMPKLQGRALEVYQLVHGMQYEEFNQSLDKSCCPTSDPGIKFTHQLFHDAESTFWIIAWNLARSVGPNYQPEKEWTSELSTFISALGSHYPSRDLPDPRIALDPSLKCWSRILHSDLANIASMLSQMHEYIEPEWAYRDGLSAGHAHEALMRLLLTEIIRIEDHPESDLPLFIGARSLPVKLIHHSSSQKSKTSSFLSIP